MLFLEPPESEYIANNIFSFILRLIQNIVSSSGWGRVLVVSLQTSSNFARLEKCVLAFL